MIKWLIFIAIVLFIDFYAFQGIKTVTKNKWILGSYWLISILVLAYLIYSISTMDRSKGFNQMEMLSFGLFILLYSPKLIVFLVLFGEDIFRIIKGSIQFLFQSETTAFLPERRVIVSKLALSIAAIPFTSVLYGMARGKYNYQIVEHTLFFDDLPEAFDGYKITHLSDIHGGSFDDAEKIAHGIDLINQQNSDVILFTGDLVNNLAEEMDPWISYFGSLKAPDGKFSVLGNHDYGEYIQWNSAKEKEINFQAVKAIHPKMGFQLLLNDSIYLEKGTDKIALIGVENWGTRFKKAGDLSVASSKVQSKDFKILMSHDPSHWDAEVKNHADNFHLTLSGHTHGMQFGIEIPGVKWSPVQYIYKQWAGIYDFKNRYINVNRGFGFLAFPGRVGIWPEISVITLKKK